MDNGVVLLFEWMKYSSKTFLTSWINFVIHTFEKHPEHAVVEAVCILAIVYLLIHRPYDPCQRNELTPTEQQTLIDEWNPHKLEHTILKLPQQCGIDTPLVVSTHDGPYLHTTNVSCPRILNFSSMDFLGISRLEEIRRVSRECIAAYGVGSCGPRGFYGTADIHLHLEKLFARFIGSEDCILYSDGIANMSSVIPAFSKAGDVIVCDEKVGHNIRSGLELSRSSIIFYAHNNMKDLEQALCKLASKCGAQARRFIVCEGLYRNEGDISPLDVIVRLKKKYKFRLIVDDSCGLGVLGRTGRGTIEHYNLEIADIDIWCANLECSIGSVGGVCCAASHIVQHQRLSGSGYVFSASSPMYTCAAAIAALNMFDRGIHGGYKVRLNATMLHSALHREIEVARWPHLIIVNGSKQSPIIHIRTPHQTQVQFYMAIHHRMLHHHCISTSIIGAMTTLKSNIFSLPSLCVNVQYDHTNADLQYAAFAIVCAFTYVLDKKVIAVTKSLNSNKDFADSD